MPDSGFVLNCNDDDAQRYVITRALRGAGYEVREAATGAAALDAVKAGPVLVVLDVNLPDMSGLDVCRQIKGEAATSAIPVLHTSALRVSTGDTVEGLESGADAYLAQPVDPAVLIATVRALLRACRAESEARRALAELVEVDRRKDEFLAMLAHELRNPLNAIATANSLQDRVGPQDEASVRLRRMIARQTRHLARLVDDLLEVSRITRGQVQLQCETFDIRQAIEQAVSSITPSLQSRRQRLSVHLPDDAPLVNGDALRLEQVLVNVIDNASKYSNVDGAIDVSCVAQHGEVRVTVADQGVGIAPEKLDAIFDLFMQVDQTLARTVGGLGLGLTIARRLIELHGGTVTAHSAGLGHGSCFVITLPLGAAASRPAAAAAPSVDLRDAAATLDVLVIEDNSDTRELMRSLVETWGHRVAVAADGTTGLAKALAMHPDVALIDIGLPGIDGYQVAQNLRASDVGRDIWLVALTGYGRPEDRARALGCGFDVHLVKPVEAERLRGVLSGSPVRRFRQP